MEGIDIFTVFQIEIFKDIMMPSACHEICLFLDNSVKHNKTPNQRRTLMDELEVKVIWCGISD